MDGWRGGWVKNDVWHADTRIDWSRSEDEVSFGSRRVAGTRDVVEDGWRGYIRVQLTRNDVQGNTLLLFPSQLVPNFSLLPLPPSFSTLASCFTSFAPPLSSSGQPIPDFTRRPLPSLSSSCFSQPFPSNEPTGSGSFRASWTRKCKRNRGLTSLAIVTVYAFPWISTGSNSRLAAVSTL